MKIFFSLIAFFAISTLAFAQQNLQDVVYLKNGSVIHGIIIEQIPNQTIKLETVYRDIFVYQMDEIERITKESFTISNEIEPSYKGLEPGYQGILEGSANLGYYDLIFSAKYINCYRVNSYFSVGVGTGIKYYMDREVPSIPVYIDFRTNIPTRKKVSPYFAFDIGYIFGLANDVYAKGFFLNPSIGIYFKNSSNSIINMGIGFEEQNIDIPDEDNFSLLKRNFNFNIGLTF